MKYFTYFFNSSSFKARLSEGKFRASSNFTHKYCGSGLDLRRCNHDAGWAEQIFSEVSETRICYGGRQNHSFSQRSKILFYVRFLFSRMVIPYFWYEHIIVSCLQNTGGAVRKLFPLAQRNWILIWPLWCNCQFPPVIIKFHPVSVVPPTLLVSTWFQISTVIPRLD